MFKIISIVTFFFMLMGDVTADPEMDEGFLNALENDLVNMKTQLKDIKEEMKMKFHDEQAWSRKQNLLTQKIIDEIPEEFQIDLHVAVTNGRKHQQSLMIMSTIYHGGGKCFELRLSYIQPLNRLDFGYKATSNAININKIMSGLKVGEWKTVRITQEKWGDTFNITVAIDGKVRYHKSGITPPKCKGNKVETRFYESGLVSVKDAQFQYYEKDLRPVTTTPGLYICQGQKKTISCPENHLIVIDEASFGREDNDHCPSASFDPNQDCTTSLGSSSIEEKCGFKENCEVLADVTELGQGDTDYCKSVDKMASIKYRCKPKVEPKFVEDLDCQEGSLDENECRQYANQNHKPMLMDDTDSDLPPGCVRECNGEGCADPKFTYKKDNGKGNGQCGNVTNCVCKWYDDVKPVTTTLAPTKPTIKVTTPTPHPGDIAVQLDCQELNMTATFDPEVLPGDILNVSVANCDDNKFQVSNGQTKLQVAFKDCSNNITQSADLITQENIVAVVNGVKEKTNEVQRIVVYYYKLQCFFDRKIRIHYGKAIEIKDREESFEQSSKTKFAATMEMYTSPGFNQLSQSPYHVTAFAPIYMQIRGLHNNKLFKFITEDCYATPTADANDKKKYYFFDDKCPLDNTYKELHHNTPNEFMFKVNAFTFIKLKKEVYFHCDLLVCKHDSKTEECTQQCTKARRRRRRAVDSSEVIETITIKSGMMEWDESAYDRPLDQQLEAVKDELAEVIAKMKKQ